MAKFVWSKSQRSYINSTTGKAVSAAALLKWVNETSDGSKERVQKLAERYNNGEISDREFQLAMRDEIDKGHSALWVAAFGGLLAMTASRWLNLRRIIGRQEGYFARFAHDILTGRVSPDQLKNRAGMYAEAIYSTYVNGTVAREREIAATATVKRDLLAQIERIGVTPEGRRAVAEAIARDFAIRTGRAAAPSIASALRSLDRARVGTAIKPPVPAGAQRARRELDPESEHCVTCVDLAVEKDEEGNPTETPIWYPIDDVPPIGDSECGSRCRCEIVFDYGTPAEAAA